MDKESLQQALDWLQIVRSNYQQTTTKLMLDFDALKAIEIKDGKCKNGDVLEALDMIDDLFSDILESIDCELREEVDHE
jgi:hypothetical protein